jgi:hypothetical protein
LAAATNLPLIARKCGLPKRVPIEPGGELPKDELPPEVSQDQSDWFAFRAFLYDFCATPTDRNVSSGYFADLAQAALELSTKSHLVNACSAVSFAAGAVVLKRPHLGGRADELYQGLVTAMICSLASTSHFDAQEMSTVTLLLGLYQVLDSLKGGQSSTGLT